MPQPPDSSRSPAVAHMGQRASDHGVIPRGNGGTGATREPRCRERCGHPVACGSTTPRCTTRHTLLSSVCALVRTNLTARGKRRSSRSAGGAKNRLSVEPRRQPFAPQQHSRSSSTDTTAAHKRGPPRSAAFTRWMARRPITISQPLSRRVYWAAVYRSERRTVFASLKEEKRAADLSRARRSSCWSSSRWAARSSTRRPT